MKKIILHLFVALFVLGCQTEQLIESGDKLTVNIVMDGEQELDSKSIITVPEKGISSITLFFFLDGKLSESIYSVPTSTSISIQSTKEYPGNANVDVYAIINAGNKTSWIQEGESIDNLINKRLTIGNALAAVNSSGFPMAGIAQNVPVGIPFTLKVQRLFAKYGFKINTQKLTKGTFEITGLALYNAAKTVTPFIENSKIENISSDRMDGDYATSLNLSQLKAGVGVYFYTLENCQGTLLPDNIDPWMKVPDSIGGVANCCTAIQVTGKYVDNSGGLSATHIYRMYLGQDNTTNFDVIRNTVYEYTLTLTDDAFLRASWKAERKVTSDSRKMSFDKNLYEVESEENCIVGMNFSPAPFNCNYELSQNLISAGVTFNSNYMTLKQTMELDEDVTGTLTAKSWDGVLTSTCTVVAKKYAPGDIIIIIKPTDNTINMTEYDAQSVTFTLARVNPDNHNEIYEEYKATEWSVSSTDDQVVRAYINANDPNTAKLSGLRSGQAYITASCVLDGVTYTSSNSNENKITVNEDRTIQILNYPTSVVPGKIYKCSLVSNYDGAVSVYSDGNYIQLGCEPLLQTHYITINAKKNVPADFWISYTGYTDRTEGIKVRTSNSTILCQKNIICYGEISYYVNYLEENEYESDNQGSWVTGWGGMSIDAYCGNEVMYRAPFYFGNNIDFTAFRENQSMSTGNIGAMNSSYLRWDITCFAFGRKKYFSNAYALPTIDPDNYYKWNENDYDFTKNKLFIEEHNNGNCELKEIKICYYSGNVSITQAMAQNPKTTVLTLTADSSTYYENVYIEHENGDLQLYAPLVIKYNSNYKGKTSICGLVMDAGTSVQYYGFFVTYK